MVLENLTHHVVGFLFSFFKRIFIDFTLVFSEPNAVDIASLLMFKPSGERIPASFSFICITYAILEAGLICDFVGSEIVYMSISVTMCCNKMLCPILAVMTFSPIT